MDSRAVKKHASWYASYADDQGYALIECMIKKIDHQARVIQSISQELELCDDPREERPEVIIESIKSLIAVDDLLITFRKGYFEWTA